MAPAQGLQAKPTKLADGKTQLLIDNLPNRYSSRGSFVGFWHFCDLPRHKNDGRPQTKSGPEVTVPFERWLRLQM
jgi:hypothetical protein